MIALASTNGVQVGFPYHGPRYRAEHGVVIDQTLPATCLGSWLALAEAEAKLGPLCREAVRAEQEGRPIYRVLAREARSLVEAIDAARAWRRAAA